MSSRVRFEILEMFTLMLESMCQNRVLRLHRQNCSCLSWILCPEGHGAVLTSPSCLSWILFPGGHGAVLTSPSCLSWILFPEGHGTVLTSPSCLSWILFPEGYGTVLTSPSCLSWILFNNNNDATKYGTDEAARPNER